MLDRTRQQDDVGLDKERPVDGGAHDIMSVASEGRGETGAVEARNNDRDKSTAPQADDDESKKTEAVADDDKANSAGWRRHPLAIGIAAIILIAAIVGGVLWYLHARHFESTDDAFIDGRPVMVSPEVSGNIIEIPVTDNQIVKAGDLLARIDARDYEAAVAQAEAQIGQAEATIENYAAQIKAQQAEVDQTAKQGEEAQAALNFAQEEDKRYQELVKTGYGTVQRAQQSASELQSKQAALAAAQSALTAAQRQIGVLKAQRRSADAQLEQAKAQKATADANLTRTQLHATMDGRVTRLTAAVGQVATQSQALMILVPLDVWVTANFKENQLADMRVGQKVDVEIDAYGGTVPGKIDSIQAGSGTAFSLLPAENATGNYVKVVQRIPVKITFDKRPDAELGPGMSVVPTVTVR